MSATDVGLGSPGALKTIKKKPMRLPGRRGHCNSSMHARDFCPRAGALSNAPRRGDTMATSGQRPPQMCPIAVGGQRSGAELAS